MRLLATALVLAVMLGASAQALRADTPEEAAQATALAWLRLIDAGDYARSWDESAAIFRNSISQTQWASRIAAVRSPLGSVKSRSMSSAKFTHSLPGAPDGQYVVLQFATSFERKAAATETVTPMKDADGQWRVSGYFIK
jgi:hypothetical protein